MNRSIAFDGISYLVLNAAGDVIERCHNRATAQYYANKVEPTVRMTTFMDHANWYVEQVEYGAMAA